MDSINKTLYIPLYGKALVSRKGIILRDTAAERIWAEEGFPLKRKSRSKWLAYFMAMRASVMDDRLAEKMASDSDAAVLHIGCGLDSRIERVGAGEHQWYDIDLEDVISVRRRYYNESSFYTMLTGDARRTDWLENIPSGGNALAVLEGISMYLDADALRGLFRALGKHFGKVWVILDCYSEKGARASRYRNPVNDVGAYRVWGMDDPHILEDGTGFLLVSELDMTPAEKINELDGFERRFFRSMFAGRIAKSIYRMYEYISTETSP